MTAPLEHGYDPNWVLSMTTVLLAYVWKLSQLFALLRATEQRADLFRAGTEVIKNTDSVAMNFDRLTRMPVIAA